MDDYGRIRRAHRDGMSIREIAKQFHHSRQKVRQILRGETEPSVLPIEVPGWQRLAGRHDQCNLKSHRQLHLFHTIGTKVAQAHP